MRVAEQAGGQAQPLAHAHGIGGDLVVGPLGQPGPVQRRADPLPGLSAPGGGEDLQVLPPGQVAVEPWLVNDRADPGQGAPALGGHGTAEQRHRAAVGPGQAQQHPDQRGLACPVRSQIAERHAARDEQVDVIDGGVGAEPLGEPVHLDGWPTIFGRSSHVSLPQWVGDWCHRR